MKIIAQVWKYIDDIKKHIFISRTTVQTSTKLETKYFRVKGIQLEIVKMKDHALFQGIIMKQGEYIFKILLTPTSISINTPRYILVVKMHWQHLKVFFSRTTGPISTKLCTNFPWVREFKFVQIKDYLILKKELLIISFSLCESLFIDWNSFSCERCWPLVFRLFSFMGCYILLLYISLNILEFGVVFLFEKRGKKIRDKYTIDQYQKCLVLARFHSFPSVGWWIAK